ncbi:MAG: sugar phosphate isomerase/epimerase family protein, partial [Planctomycetota bacterium]
KFGYSSNAFRRYPLLRVMDMVADIGFTGVELLADFPHLWPDDWTDEARLSGLRAAIDRRGLTVTNLNTFTMFAVGGFGYPSWISSQPDDRRARREYTRDCIRLAARLGAPTVTVMPGGRRNRDPWDDRRTAYATFRDGLRRLIPMAAELGVKVLIEPEPDCLIERYTEFLEFVSTLEPAEASHVGMNCDVGHLVCAGDDPATVIRECGSWIRHVHVEDIKNRVHEHLICGLGDIDFVQVLGALDSIGYAGYVTVELYPYQDTPMEAGRQSLEHLVGCYERVVAGETKSATR